MSRFKRLSDTEARTLTRRELLDRIEAEQAYWFRKKKSMTPEDDAAFREFTRIMYRLPVARLDRRGDAEHDRPHRGLQPRPLLGHPAGRGDP